MLDPKNKTEVIQDIKLKGNQLVDKVREIIEEGNARRVIIMNKDRVVIEFPLSVGVGGAAAAILWAPTLAAIGAFAALVTDVRVIVEKEDRSSDIIVSPEEKDTSGI